MRKDWKCSHLNSFEVINEEERAKLLLHFNGLESHDEQISYLGGLITILAIQNRRPRQREDAAKCDAFISYRLRVENDDQNKADIPAYAKGYYGMNCITKNKLTNSYNVVYLYHMCEYFWFEIECSAYEWASLSAPSSYIGSLWIILFLSTVQFLGGFFDGSHAFLVSSSNFLTNMFIKI